MAKQRRRTKGTGTVFQRSSDKLWVGGVENPKNKRTGQRSQRRVYSKTRSGAQAKLAGISRTRKRK
jgi:hypothetical protein